MRKSGYVIVQLVSNLRSEEETILEDLGVFETKELATKKLTDLMNGVINSGKYSNYEISESNIGYSPHWTVKPVCQRCEYFYKYPCNECGKTHIYLYLKERVINDA